MGGGCKCHNFCQEKIMAILRNRAVLILTLIEDLGNITK